MSFIVKAHPSAAWIEKKLKGAPPKINITLNNSTLQYCSQVATDRQRAGIHKQGKHGIDQKQDGWQENIKGAQGEAALAKHYGVWWDGNLGDFLAADVGNLQVRSNGKYWGDLMTHPEDADDQLWVLALVHDIPIVRFAGWAWGYQAKQKGYWREAGPQTPNRPAFFMPQCDLNPMSELPVHRIGGIWQEAKPPEERKTVILPPEPQPGLFPKQYVDPGDAPWT